MDSERLLVSKIIEEGDLLDIADSGITPEFFLDPTNRQVYSTIMAYKVEHGEVPTLRRIKKDYPNYKFVSVEEPFSDLIQQVRKSHALAVLENALSEAVDAYDEEDEVLIQKVLHTALGKLAADVPNMRDTDITKTGEERLERYEALRHRDNRLLGIPSGFNVLDTALQGFQKKQLIVFAGPPKAGKSTTMLLASRTAHLAGYSPLVVGFEMTNEEQEMRLDSIAAEISHHRLREGSLRDEEIKRLKRSVHQIENMKQFIFSNDTMSTSTLSGVAAKVERYKPDMLIVDGVYMMQDENGEAPGSPQALTNITRGFKRMAQNMDIPIIITTQVLEWKMDKKRGITSNSIGYSSSFAQDADAIIGVEKTDDETINKIKIVIARNSPPRDVYVRWDWETGKFEELDGNPFDEMDGEDQYEENF